MASLDPWQRRLSDLQLDLRIERDKLSELVSSLKRLEGFMEAGKGSSETVDSAALRLQSLYTGVERCLLLIVRVLNGGTPEGSDWHRRLLDRMAVVTDSRPAVLSPAVRLGLAELLAFRHVVRHLYAYELDADRVRLLLERAIAMWPGIEEDLERFQAWLEELVAA
ncbi:MAG: hypothetical protein QUV06_12660 [Cyanobium sp. CZS 48M]|nr:hypothetical protein [Cyanobium sp. CZS48M]